MLHYLLQLSLLCSPSSSFPFFHHIARLLSLHLLCLPLFISTAPLSLFLFFFCYAPSLLLLCCLMLPLSPRSNHLLLSLPPSLSQSRLLHPILQLHLHHRLVLPPPNCRRRAPTIGRLLLLLNVPLPLWPSPSSLHLLLLCLLSPSPLPAATVRGPLDASSSLAASPSPPIAAAATAEPLLEITYAYCYCQTSRFLAGHLPPWLLFFPPLSNANSCTTHSDLPHCKTTSVYCHSSHRITFYRVKEWRRRGGTSLSLSPLYILFVCHVISLENFVKKLLQSFK